MKNGGKCAQKVQNIKAKIPRLFSALKILARNLHAFWPKIVHNSAEKCKIIVFL